MATAWPSISTPQIFDEQDIKPQHEFVSEAEYFFTRSKGTAAKVEFTLGWTYISKADKATLKAFFQTNQAGEITFTHPDPDVATSHTVKFNNGNALPPFKWNNSRGTYSITGIKLREI